MELNGKATYFVAVKVFFRDNNKLLLVHDAWNNWELPGGRIKPHEFQKPLEEVVARKISEELGDEIRYHDLKPTGAFLQVKRLEDVNDGSKQDVRIFGIGFEAQYDGGELNLGDAHDQVKWVDVKTFQPLKLQDNDWMRGVEDYLKMVNEREG